MARPRAFDEDRVLDAVMETFWRNGYEGTSAQDLVEATGLGRGSLYAAYTSKDGLFEQALMRYHEQSQAHAEQVRLPGSALERLRAFMLAVVDSSCGCLATNSAIEKAAHDPRVADLVRRSFDILTGGIEDAIRRGQAAGEIRPDADARTLALFVFNAVQGLRVLTRTRSDKDRDTLVAVVDVTLAALR